VVGEPEGGVADHVVGEPEVVGIEGEGVDPEALGLHQPAGGSLAIAGRQRSGDPGRRGADHERAYARDEAPGAPGGDKAAVVADLERQRAAVRHDHHRSVGHGPNVGDP
jgi:hypothetical protein